MPTATLHLHSKLHVYTESNLPKRVKVFREKFRKHLSQKDTISQTKTGRVLLTKTTVIMKTNMSANLLYNTEQIFEIELISPVQRYSFRFQTAWKVIILV